LAERFSTATLTNFDPLLWRQFGPATADASSPAFRHWVCGILFGGAQKQMRWPDTARVVAPMTDLDATRDWTDEQNVRSPRSRHASFAKLEHAISVVIDAASPEPARRRGWLVYAADEPFRSRCPARGV